MGRRKLPDNMRRIRRNFSLAPETIERLSHFPNASKTVEFLVNEEWLRKNKRRRF